MKNNLAPIHILFIIFTMTLILAPGLFAFKAAPKVVMPPNLKTRFAAVDEVQALTHATTYRRNLFSEVNALTGEVMMSRNEHSLERQMVLKAKKDLAHRLSIKIDRIKLLEVRQVTWPDASLGCPQPGKVYNQVLQDGLLIRLEVGGRMYFYHSGGDLEPFLCKQTSRMMPHPTENDEFVPPPGSEID